MGLLMISTGVVLHCTNGDKIKPTFHLVCWKAQNFSPQTLSSFRWNRFLCMKQPRLKQESVLHLAQRAHLDSSYFSAYFIFSFNHIMWFAVTIKPLICNVWRRTLNVFPLLHSFIHYLTLFSFCVKVCFAFRCFMSSVVFWGREVVLRNPSNDPPTSLNIQHWISTTSFARTTWTLFFFMDFFRIRKKREKFSDKRISLLNFVLTQWKRISYEGGYGFERKFFARDGIFNPS